MVEAAISKAKAFGLAADPALWGREIDDERYLLVSVK